MMELPENAQHPQRMLHTPMMMAVIAVIISLFRYFSPVPLKDPTTGRREPTNRRGPAGRRDARRADW